MFDFISDEHRMIQDAAREFARDRIAPIAAAHDESGDFPLAYHWAMSRTLRLADGPDEVHRESVAKLELAKQRVLRGAL